MSHSTGHISPQALEILQQIANGQTYEQILLKHPQLTYLDIFSAAREAVDLDQAGHSAYHARIKEIKSNHPRAYQSWSTKEDDELKVLVSTNTPVKQIAKEFQRQPSAIRSRINKLGLSPTFSGTTDSILKSNGQVF